MIYNYITRPQSPYPQTIHAETHEHRAPTDDSIAMLREMEAKARDQLIMQIKLPDGPVPLAAMVQYDGAKDCTWFAVKVKLGSKEKLVKWHAYLDYRDERDKAIDEIFKGCCEAVAKELMTGVMAELVKTLRR